VSRTTTALVAAVVAALVGLRLAAAPPHGFSWLVVGLVAGFSLSGSV
jgi:hypothetical protein